MTELTKRRIDISIERLTELRDQYYSASGFTADREQSYMFRNKVAALDTALTALDAVRWRKPSEELPECFEIVLIYNGEGVHPCEYVNAYDDPDVAIWRLYGHDDKYCWTTDEIVAWLPLPKWED